MWCVYFINVGGLCGGFVLVLGLLVVCFLFGFIVNDLFVLGGFGICRGSRF